MLAMAVSDLLTSESKNANNLIHFSSLLWEKHIFILFWSRHVTYSTLLAAMVRCHSITQFRGLYDTGI